MHNRVIRAVAARRHRHGGSAGMISNTLPQSLIDNPILSQWIAFDGARPRPRRQRQGRDRAGHPDRAHADRRRGTRCRLRAGAAGVGADRCQPGGRVHLGQLFGRGRRRFDPAGLRRGAFAVPRSRRRASSAARRASFRSRTENSCAAARRPATTTGRSPARSCSIAGRAAPRRSSGRRATGSSGAACRGSICPAKVSGAAFIHDIVPDGVVHARVLRQPWRGARLVDARRAGGAAAPPRRRSTFCARAISSPSRRTSEIAVMRAAEAARTLARWEGGEPAPDDIGEPEWLKAQPSRDRTVETGHRRPAQGRTAAWSRRSTAGRS